MAEADPPARTISLGTGVAAVDAAAWDALHDGGNPFVGHAFLSLLEESGSVGPGTGWQAAPLLVEDEAGALLAAAPAYLKSHSQGEYVFDQGWADAWARAGGDYYPKLQIAAPFTPVPGPRLLAPDSDDARLLIRAAETVVRQNGLSSAHATFVAPDQMPLFEGAGWLVRRDIQFHFANAGYASFDDFLATLTSAKRKQLRKERARAVEGLRIEELTGDAIRPEHWDAMWLFYQDTGARKWGQPYLTRAAFDLIGARMAEQIILLLAYDGERAGGGGVALPWRRYALRALLGLPDRHPLSAFRAMLLPRDRHRDRTRAGARRGGGAGRSQARARLWSGRDLVGAFHRRSRVPPRGGRFSGTGTPRRRSRDGLAGRAYAISAGGVESFAQDTSHERLIRSDPSAVIAG